MLGVPLTHRHHARRLQFVTGHDHKGALPEDIDWRSLADDSVTTVVYMAKKTLAVLSASVCAHGLPGNTAAVAVMDATLPTQRVIRGTITDLPAKLEAANLSGPVLVMIGNVLNS
jgi:uroporphyrin-III C-methyltransferase/precorrin-2 dehydrogenase/sirohydrochlorin ferrochelatase